MAVVCALAAPVALAGEGLAGDASASLQARNFYLNRAFDRVPPGAQQKRDEWAQGFMLRLHSGYTGGPIGFAIEGYGATAIKLDSTPAHAGSGLLDSHYGERAPAVAAEGYLTAKARSGKTTLAVGGMELQTPVLGSVDIFLLPQWFEGSLLRAQGVGKFDFEAGVIHRINQSGASDSDDLSITGPAALNIDFADGPRSSDRFSLIGTTFRPLPPLSLSYHYGQLDNLYRQQVFNAAGWWPVDGRARALGVEARYLDTGSQGVTNIDNRAWAARFSYHFDHLKLSASYQDMSGSTGYPYINSSNAYLFNFVELNAFNHKDEQSWQLRFDYDFAGLPGLSFMTRYVSGDSIDVGTGIEGREWERDSDLQYVFKQGLLRNVSLRWRNATVRKNFGPDVDEHRVIINYTIDLL
ncbi:hypothetical protein ABB29_06400 [Pseudoxanthomonas dokdonensis]|uniref:Porin n=2 Tax=Pseudoxanthomonas dokdonensis TaxID=344882 RepID=A0A0R0CV54_9GAMM|nr:hypothetical protein ABB29_06400 [Pseudoxanthomonas dokdonensis]